MKTEPMNQGIDFHEAYLHRKQVTRMGGTRFKFHVLLGKDLGFFRPEMAYYGGIRVGTEGDNFVTLHPADPHTGPALHPGVDAVWPAKQWWRRLSPRRRVTGGTGGNGQALMGVPPFPHAAQLPSIIRTGSGSETQSLHMRWMTPIDKDLTRTWTFTLGRRPKTLLGRLYKNLWYYFWRKPTIIVRTNEWEDLVVFMRDRLRFDLPQKLGPLDTGVIYFRRHLARRSRDFRRLGGAHGTNKAPPQRTGAEWREAVAAGADENIAPDNRVEAEGALEAAGG